MFFVLWQALDKESTYGKVELIRRRAFFYDDPIPTTRKGESAMSALAVIWPDEAPEGGWIAQNPEAVREDGPPPLHKVTSRRAQRRRTMRRILSGIRPCDEQEAMSTPWYRCRYKRAKSGCHRITVVRLLHEPVTGIVEAHVTRTRSKPACDERHTVLERAQMLEMEPTVEVSRPTRLRKHPDDDLALALYNLVYPPGTTSRRSELPQYVLRRQLQNPVPLDFDPTDHDGWYLLDNEPTRPLTRHLVEV